MAGVRRFFSAQKNNFLRRGEAAAERRPGRAGVLTRSPISSNEGKWDTSHGEPRKHSRRVPNKPAYPHRLPTAISERKRLRLRSSSSIRQRTTMKDILKHQAWTAWHPCSSYDQLSFLFPTLYQEESRLTSRQSKNQLQQRREHIGQLSGWIKKKWIPRSARQPPVPRRPSTNPVRRMPFNLRT